MLHRNDKGRFPYLAPYLAWARSLARPPQRRGLLASTAFACVFALSLPAFAQQTQPAEQPPPEEVVTKEALVAEGHEIFNLVCHLCHSDQKGVNRIGPSLYGVVGRKVASVPGYSYSEAMRKFGEVWGRTWTPEELDHYLTNPQKWIPGVNMHYSGLKHRANRQAIIAYLSTLHD
jgi:cytochrome c